MSTPRAATPPRLRLMTGRRKSTWDTGDLGELASSAFALLKGVVREGQEVGDVRTGQPFVACGRRLVTDARSGSTRCRRHARARAAAERPARPGVLVSTTVDVLLGGLCADR